MVHLELEFTGQHGKARFQVKDTGRSGSYVIPNNVYDIPHNPVRPAQLTVDVIAALALERLTATLTGTYGGDAEFPFLY